MSSFLFICSHADKIKKTDNHYGIEENNLKIDIGNIYPVYSYPFATRNEHFFSENFLRM